MIDINLLKYEIDPEILEYDHEFGIEPKVTTYYLIYGKAEFSIIANKIGFKEQLGVIVKKFNGYFDGGKDEFISIEDIDKAVCVLRKLFSNENYLLSILSKEILKEFPDPSKYDENTLEALKTKFYMFDEEVVIQSISYMANHSSDEEIIQLESLLNEEFEDDQNDERLCSHCNKYIVNEEKQDFVYIDEEENFSMSNVNPLCDICISNLKERPGEEGRTELYFEPKQQEENEEDDKKIKLKDIIYKH